MNRAQVMIETTLVTIVLVLLLIGVMRIFVWFNLRMVEREEEFARTRGNMRVDFYPITPQRKLHVFSEEGGLQ